MANVMVEIAVFVDSVCEQAKKRLPDDMMKLIETDDQCAGDIALIVGRLIVNMMIEDAENAPLEIKRQTLDTCQLLMMFIALNFVSETEHKIATAIIGQEKDRLSGVEIQPT